MAGYEKFESVVFLNECYGNVVEFQNIFNKYREIFHEGGGLPGRRLLDFGCGPTLAYALSVGDNFTDIVMADYAEPNIKLLQKWKETGEYPFDWSHYYDLIVHSSSQSELQEKYESRLDDLRKNVKEILLCDANKSDPITPSFRGSFDVIISSFAIELAATTLDQYKKCVKNVMTLLKPGGKLLMVTVGEESFWDVGGKRYYAIPADEELVTDALTEAGMSDIKTEVTTEGTKTLEDFDEDKYFIISTATKS